MNEMQVFSSSEFGSVRTVSIGGEPYFVGKDVAEILGYSNPRKAIIDHVEEDDKTDGVTIRDAIGREQNPVCINESGLYSLILGSKLESAKRFKRWVTAEVLPAIRRYGLYAIDDILADPDIAIRALTALKEERAKTKSLQNTVAVQSQQLLELQPKASYYDVVLNCKDLVAISVIAKDYGWSAKRMNRQLHELGVQFKQGDKIWMLYQKYADKGYTSTKTVVTPGSDGDLHPRVHTYWTQKGRLFIYSLLKEHGILPMMER